MRLMRVESEFQLDMASDSSARRWLWGILLAALLLRLWYLLELKRTPFFDHLILDLASYDAWGLRTAGGDWLGSQVYYQDPLYPYLLGVLYRIFGHNLTVVYVLQAALGTSSCYLIYLIGRKLFSRPAGLIAAAMAALYKPFIFYDIQIEKSFLAVLLVSAACVSLLRAIESRAPAPWLVAGLVLALAVLVRGNYLLLFPLIALGILCLAEVVRPWRATALYSLGLASILVVTLARNYLVGDDWVLTTSQAGQNFYIGNNPENTAGMYRAPDFVRPDPRFEEGDFAREAERQLGRRLRPSEISGYWFSRSLAYIVERPLDFLRNLGRKTALFWNAYEVPDNLDLYFFEHYSILMRLPLPTFGLVAPLGLLGMIMCIAHGRRLWALYVFSLGYFFSVILFYVFSRYRLPVVPFLLVFAAQSLLLLARDLSRRRTRSLVYAGVLLAVCAAGVHLPLVSAYNPSAIDNLGAVLLRMGDTDGAESLFRQAIGRRPDYAGAHNNLGVVLMRKGDVDGAEAAIREAIRLKPRHANSYINLGQLLLRRHDLKGSLDAFRQALSLDPTIAEAHAGMGMLQRAMGDLAGAAGSLRKALELDPESAEIHNNLGITLISLGQTDEALRHLEIAMRLKPEFAEACFNQGICLERMKKPELAIAAYRHAVALRPGYAEAYNNLGNLLAETGDRVGAVAAYEAFLRSWKGDPRIRAEVEDEMRRLK